jgi:hypothetical protein
VDESETFTSERSEMLSLRSSSLQLTSRPRRRAAAAPISVGQVSLQECVAQLMVHVHRIPRELADYHVATFDVEELVRRLRMYSGMELSVGGPKPERATCVLPGSHDTATMTAGCRHSTAFPKSGGN